MKKIKLRNSIKTARWRNNRRGAVFSSNPLVSFYDQTEDIFVDIGLIGLKNAALRKILQSGDIEQRLETVLGTADEIAVLLNKVQAYIKLSCGYDVKNQVDRELEGEFQAQEKEFHACEILLALYLESEKWKELAAISPAVSFHSGYIERLSHKPFNFAYHKEKDEEHLRTYQKAFSSLRVYLDNKTYLASLSTYDLWACNELRQHQAAYLREQAKLFAQKQDLFAEMYNNTKLASVNNARLNGHDDLLDMSLRQTGLPRTCLENLFQAIELHQDNLEVIAQKYMTGSRSRREYSEGDLKRILVKSVHPFDPTWATLIEKMFDHGHLDLQTRSNKMVGSCHVKILASCESRIIAHFGGDIKGVLDVAHELGHAFHSFCVMKSNPPVLCEIPLLIIETGAIFAQLLAFDALLNDAQNDGEKNEVLASFSGFILEALVDVYARYLFESQTVRVLQASSQRFSACDLNSVMEASLKKAYGANPFASKYLWIYKPHFYSKAEPFYNYPYAFGTMIAISMYRLYKTKRLSEAREKIIRFFNLSSKIPIAELCGCIEIDIMNPSCFDEGMNAVEALLVEQGA